MYSESRVESFNHPESINEMRNAIIKSLNDNRPVWFGCDVDKYINSEYGLLNEKVYDYESIFDDNFEIEKTDSLYYNSTELNHAMLFKGYDKDKNDKITQYLVENSWGKDYGIDGEYIMSDNWFKKYTIQAVVDKKYLNKKLLKYLNKKPIICPIWDPIGTLAMD